MSEEERRALIEGMKKDANSADEKLQKALKALSPAALNAVKEVLQGEKGNADLRAHNGGVLMQTSEGDEIFVKTTEKGDVFYKSDRERQTSISQHKDGRFSYTDAGQEEFMRVDNSGMVYSDNDISVEITDGKLIARDEEEKPSFEADRKELRAAWEDDDGTYVFKVNGRKFSLTRVNESEGTTSEYEMKARKNGTVKSFKGEKQSEEVEASFEIGFEKDGETIKSVKAESITRSDTELEKSNISLNGENLTIKTVQVIDDGNGWDEKRKTELRLRLKGDFVAKEETLDELLSDPAFINGEAVREGSVNEKRIFESVQKKAGMIAGAVIDNVTELDDTIEFGELSKEKNLVLLMKRIRER